MKRLGGANRVGRMQASKHHEFNRPYMALYRSNYKDVAQVPGRSHFLKIVLEV